MKISFTNAAGNSKLISLLQHIVIMHYNPAYILASDRPESESEITLSPTPTNFVLQYTQKVHVLISPKKIKKELLEKLWVLEKNIEQIWIQLVHFS